MVEWERTVLQAELVAARMAGFPQNLLDDYQRRGLRERFNKKKLFAKWVGDHEVHQAKYPGTPHCVPSNWLTWASAGALAKSLVERADLMSSRAFQRAAAPGRTTYQPNY